MAESLSFDGSAIASVWSEGAVALGGVGLAQNGARPVEPVVHSRGHLTAVSDFRFPETPDNPAAHETVFDALDRGAFPETLDGEFAIAVWDSRRGALILARDRVGIRPLFFTRPAEDCLAFASFPEALIDSGLVKGRFTRARLAERAIGTYHEGRLETRIEDVYRLPPGHTLTLDSGGERMRRYWRFPVGEASDAHSDHASAARALRQHLERAVSRALPRRGPIFTHLSGGLDSAAVTALAARVSGRPCSEVNACCFTLPEGGPELGIADEELAARALAQRIGVTFFSHPMDAVRDMCLAPLARAFVTPDNPDDPNIRLVARASAEGAESVLCGFGGDEVVSCSGRGAVLTDFLALRWRTMLRTGRGLGQPLWRTLGNEAAEALLTPNLSGRLREAIGRPTPHRRLRNQLVRPEYRERQGWSRPTVDPVMIQRARLERAEFWERLERQAWRSARHGIRYVFPLLDWRLLEFAATVPPRLQLHGGLRRALFRSALTDLLTPELLERPAKVNPESMTVYMLAFYRDELIREVRRVAASEAASAVIDLAEIERRLAELPAPETAAEETRRGGDTRSRNRRAKFVLGPFLVARALAQNEADCAAREGARHQAA